jgi:hypothetical protein
MMQKLIIIANDKPNVNKLLDIILRIVVNKEMGKLEVSFSQGGVTSVNFNKKEL